MEIAASKCLHLISIILFLLTEQTEVAKDHSTLNFLKIKCHSCFGQLWTLSGSNIWNILNHARTGTFKGVLIS